MSEEVMRRQALAVLAILEATYPQARCALDYDDPFQLLVATILSAQCTDVQVNKVAPGLFRRYPHVHALAGAEVAEVAALIRSIGFFNSKAKNLVAAAQALVERHGGAVPRTMAELTALAGVGRKTANVVLGNAFGIPGMVVDTHVRRVAGRLGWTRQREPEKIEQDLMRLLPPARWTPTSHLLIWHGRQICRAPVPHCSICPVQALCRRQGVARAK